MKMHCALCTAFTLKQVGWSLQVTALGVDRYVFFRADTDTDYYRSSRPITDIRVWCKNEN